MKKFSVFFSTVFTILLAIFMNGCDASMNAVVDTVMDQSPEPETEPMLPEVVGEYVFSGTLDHQAPIYDVAFHWDGKTLVSLGETDVKFWDPYTGQLKKTLPVEGEARWIEYAFEDNVRLGGPDRLPFFVIEGHTSLVRTVVEEGPGLPPAAATKPSICGIGIQRHSNTPLATKGRFGRWHWVGPHCLPVAVGLKAFICGMQTPDNLWGLLS